MRINRRQWLAVLLAALPMRSVVRALDARRLIAFPATPAAPAG